MKKIDIKNKLIQKRNRYVEIANDFHNMEKEELILKEKRNLFNLIIINLEKKH